MQKKGEKENFRNKKSATYLLCESARVKLTVPGEMGEVV